MKDPLTYTPIDIGRKGIDWILVVLYPAGIFRLFFVDGPELSTCGENSLDTEGGKRKPDPDLGRKKEGQKKLN